MIKFLSDDIWPTTKTLSNNSRKTKVAVAYFGTGAATQLKLKKGDILLVAMTLQNVKAGQVNPFEVEKLYNKGVEIFNLSNLHSKIYLFDKKVIIGSASVSTNSANTLIETAILTNDSNTVLQANRFIIDNCIERVEQDYIKICKKNYNPPKFFGNKKLQKSAKFKGQLSALWVISTHSIDFKDADYDTLKTDQKIHENKVANKRVFEVDDVKYPTSGSFISKVKEGDILIELFRSTKTTLVTKPQRVLGVSWDKKRPVAFLRKEISKKLITKPWYELEKILRRNNIKAITKNSRRQIVNETTKKILLDYFN